VGREVDSIIKDLVDVAVKLTREAEMDKVRHRANGPLPRNASSTPLLPRPRAVGFEAEPEPPRDADTRQRFRKMLREHQLDDREVEVEVRAVPASVDILAPPGMEELSQQLQGMFQNLGGQRSRPGGSRCARPSSCSPTRRPPGSSTRTS